MSSKKLTRSKNDALVAGVCSGLAKYFGWDPVLVRVMYIILSVISAAFPGLLVYLVLWVIMPSE